jgi:hypothetical protein
MVFVTSAGSFDRTEKFLMFLRTGALYRTLDGFARQGVAALASATPVDTGLTAASWDYSIESGPGSCKITWTNSNTEEGFPVAIKLQFGHGTGTGGYVAGRDYINPAIRPVMDSIANAVWRVVTSA